MTELIELLESLNHGQTLYAHEMADNASYEPEIAHQELFKKYKKQLGANKNRIILDFQTDEDVPHDPEISQFLHKNGWFVHHYGDGMAGQYVKDKEGRYKIRTKSIGKVLQSLGGDAIPHSKMSDRLIKDKETGKPIYRDGRMVSEVVPNTLLSYFNNDPNRSTNPRLKQIIISKDIGDIAGMSTGRCWDRNSCMNLDKGEFRDFIEGDFENRNLIAYLVHKGDHDIEKPIGRILLKRFTGGGHNIYRTTNSRLYGDGGLAFQRFVDDFAKENWKSKPNTTYRLGAGQYSEHIASVIPPLKNGLHKTDDVIEHYVDGELHDYIDEEGTHQPALIQKNDDGSVTKTHYKNNLIHREGDLPAIIHERPDGAVMYTHAINGKITRINAPARYLIPSKSHPLEHHEEWMVNNVLHRHGGEPALLIKDKDGRVIQFSHNVYGVETRENDLPSSKIETPDKVYYNFLKNNEEYEPKHFVPEATSKKVYANGVEIKTT